MTDWLLRRVAIEGFRGVNNEGEPLVLDFNPDRVSSISAPNGVGKSSIFESVLYVLQGEIRKLEILPAAENARSYYLNRFHPGGLGTIQLVLAPAGGGADITLTVTRDAHGSRTVNASGGADANAILSDLNQEFVLLDGKTFQEFIDHRPVDRGRCFAGLLGLRRYSATRQGLQSTSNTLAFNNHFGIAAKEQQKLTQRHAVDQAWSRIRGAYQVLAGEPLDPSLSREQVLSNALSALQGIPILAPICDGKAFHEVLPDECVQAAKAAEGGEDRVRYTALLTEETKWRDASDSVPSASDATELIKLAAARDEALAATSGDLFQKLYSISEQILASDAWPDKTVCPACERGGPNSVLDFARTKAANYEAVEAATTALGAEWATKGWNQLGNLEKLASAEAEQARLAGAQAKIDAGGLDESFARELTEWVSEIAARAKKHLAELETEKAVLEQKLPESTAAVVENIEAFRRLQSAVTDLRTGEARLTAIEDELARISRVKKFLDEACTVFSSGESRAATRRMQAIEPVCREIFQAIMFEPVVPALTKRPGTEELSISLAEFWTLQNVSAQAVLSESYRNAFAFSVYLAAASLYGGGAKFIIFDDVTSSFDCGHQLHLVEVIRTRFARPAVPDGPQVIILSHDTMLEKLFNKNSHNPDWTHQRIVGNARTAVLPQSGAVNKVRDATIGFLNVGRVGDAEPRIRQYLEYKLENLILKLKIRVPFDVAYSSEKQMVHNLIDAIKEQLNLHHSAGTLVLKPGQVASFNTAVATITGNYLSHWGTAQAQAYTAGALMGVMQAIDALDDCFRFEHPAGSGNIRFYHSLGREI